MEEKRLSNALRTIDLKDLNLRHQRRKLILKGSKRLLAWLVHHLGHLLRAKIESKPSMVSWLTRQVLSNQKVLNRSVGNTSDWRMSRKVGLKPSMSEVRAGTQPRSNSWRKGLTLTTSKFTSGNGTATSKTSGEINDQLRFQWIVLQSHF